MSEVVPASEKPLFSKKHELLTMLKSLKKASKRAIEVLETHLESEDEKIAQAAATTLVKLYRDVANDVREDEIRALLLDIKSSGLIGNGTTSEDDDTPVLDFDNLNPEFLDAEVVDMKEVSKIG